MTYFDIILVFQKLLRVKKFANLRLNNCESFGLIFALLWLEPKYDPLYPRLAFYFHRPIVKKEDIPDRPFRNFGAL